MWTRFMDMHSGGGLKENHQYIFIEAPEEESKVVFYNRFGHNPERVTCTCCGEDYSISETETLQEATAYDRACAYVYRDNNGNEVTQIEAWKNKIQGKYEERPDNSGMSFRDHYQTIDEYLKSDEAMFIFDKDIKPEERTGSIPDQGYVWVD